MGQGQSGHLNPQEKKALQTITLLPRGLNTLGKLVQQLECWCATHQDVAKASIQVEQAALSKKYVQEDMEPMAAALQLNSGKLEENVIQYLRSIISFSNESIEHLSNAHKDTLRIGVIPKTLLPFTRHLKEMVDKIRQDLDALDRVLKAVCFEKCVTAAPGESGTGLLKLITIFANKIRAAVSAKGAAESETCSKSDKAKKRVASKVEKLPSKTDQSDPALQQSVEKAKDSIAIFFKYFRNHEESVVEVGKLLIDLCTTDQEHAIDSLAKRRYPCVQELDSAAGAFAELVKLCQNMIDTIRLANPFFGVSTCSTLEGV